MDRKTVAVHKDMARRLAWLSCYGGKLIWLAQAAEDRPAGWTGLDEFWNPALSPTRKRRRRREKHVDPVPFPDRKPQISEIVRALIVIGLTPRGEPNPLAGGAAREPGVLPIVMHEERIACWWNNRTPEQWGQLQRAAPLDERVTVSLPAARLAEVDAFLGWLQSSPEQPATTLSGALRLLIRGLVTCPEQVPWYKSRLPPTWWIAPAWRAGAPDPT